MKKSYTSTASNMAPMTNIMPPSQADEQRRATMENIKQPARQELRSPARLALFTYLTIVLAWVIGEEATQPGLPYIVYVSRNCAGFGHRQRVDEVHAQKSIRLCVPLLSQTFPWVTQTCGVTPCMGYCVPCWVSTRGMSARLWWRSGRLSRLKSRRSGSAARMATRCSDCGGCSVPKVATWVWFGVSRRARQG
eukprot:1158617-Pelagomonas_calceolata.AAC.9